MIIMLPERDTIRRICEALASGKLSREGRKPCVEYRISGITVRRLDWDSTLSVRGLAKCKSVSKPDPTN
jgi:hypothetical protein